MNITSAVTDATAAGDIVRGLDEEISKLNLSVSDSERHQLYHLRRKHNLLLPIHRLPVECFVDIINLTFDRLQWTLQRSKQLAGVSTYWRDVLVPSPILWKRIDVEDGLRSASLILRKNLSSPLEVTCGLQFHVSAATKFVEMAAATSFRWTSLVYSGQPLETLHSAISKAEKLQYLYLHISGTRDEPPITLASGTHIRHLEFHSIGLCWDNLQLPSLETLVLSDPTNVPSAEQMIHMLSSAPKLRHLSIETPRVGAGSLTPSDVHDAQSLTVSPLRLQYLHTLHLRYVPQRLVAGILLHVEAPHVHSLDIRYAPSVIFDPEISRPFRSLLHDTMLRFPSFDLVFYGTQEAITILSGTPSITYGIPTFMGSLPGVFIQTDIKSSDWEDVTSVLPLQTSLRDLSLVYHGSPASVNDLSALDARSVLQDSSAASMLQIVGIPDATFLIEYLSSRHQDRFGNESWPLPHLKTLTIWGWNSLYAANVKRLMQTFQRNRNLGPSPPVVQLEKIMLPETLWRLVRGLSEFSNVSCEPQYVTDHSIAARASDTIWRFRQSIGI